MYYNFGCYCLIHSSPLNIEEIPNTRVKLGDGPHWKHPNLYYADLGSGVIVRIDAIANKTYKCQIANQTRVSFIIPYKNSNNLFAVGIGHNGAQLKWDGLSETDCPIIQSLFEVETSDPLDVNNCLNDGKCDSNGRLFTGTANCAIDFRLLRQHVYKYANGHLEIVQRHVNMSNGLTWNDKRNEFYYIDSGANTITQFEYDTITGAAVNPKIVFTLNATQFPSNQVGWIIMDGMTIDNNGNLYVAIFGGGSVLQISTQSWEIENQYKMPCTFVTSVAFGGPKLDVLYVTSAAELFGMATFPAHCGAVFQVNGIAASGLRMHNIVA